MSVRLMTYDEAAVALGRSPEAVRQLCKRKRWKRVVGNDGRARISVPEEDLATLRPPDDPRPSDRTAPERPPDAPQDVSAPNPDARALIALLQTRVGDLQGRVVELETEAKEGRAALARVGVLEALLETERKHVEEVRETERMRVEEIRETERQRAEEWKMVADRFAAQTEQVLAAQARRSWWPWRRRA